MSDTLPDFIKLPDNAQEIYDSINDRIKSIMTKIEGHEPSDEDVKEHAGRIHHEEESYLEIIWRDTPIARVFPIEIKREKIEGDLYNYNLKQQFMDLTNE